MAKLTREDVLKLAKLSRLELNDDEVKQFSDEISKILNYVEQLQKVEAKGLDPTFQVTGLKNVSRPDKIEDYGVSSADLLKNVPKVKNGQIKVKRIL
jgi:aspartyl-tRNA(Asn)/glutamyl-tRNA(Gln) amidotransferase subunit C